MYYRIGHDWDGLGALAAAVSPQQIKRVPLVVPVLARPVIPAGSIVPTIRARRPVGLKRMTPTDVAILRTIQDRTIRRAAAIRAMPVKQVTAYARTLQGFIPPGTTFGSVDDTSTIEGMGEMIRDLQAQLAEVTEEIRGTVGERLQETLGGMMLAQRAGDISAALGFDVVMQDLTQNCSGELARVMRAGALLSDSVMSADNFGRIASVFKDQGWSVSSLKTFAQGVAVEYENIAEDFLNIAVGDAAAYGEGGLRRMVEGALSEVSAAMPEWLTGANLERVGNAAQAWVGAAGSGKTSQYVAAAGATIAAAGAVIPQPAGIIVSAVGGLISLIGSFLGDDPEPLPPELVACTGAGGSYDHPWAYNPEAWAALAFCIVAKEGFQDSPTYRAAQTRISGRYNPLVQEVITEAKWWCTIDRYTGEVMVQEPPVSGRQQPLRRLLDVFDIRKILEDRGLVRAVEDFHAMADSFGCVPQSVRWSEVTEGSGLKNFLFCYPDPKETFTRFLGSGSLHDNIRVHAFRHNWTSGVQAPENLGGNKGWDVLGNDTFWKSYRAGLVASIYLGGTVPYGIVRGSGGSTVPPGVVTGVGVGGARVPRVGSAEGAGNIGFVIFTDPWGTTSVNESNWTTIRRSNLDSLLLPRNGAEWALANRVAMPSPDVQIDPGSDVRRPSNQRCGPVMPDGRQICMMVPQMTLSPVAFLRKTDAAGAVTDKVEKAGMSTGAKVALGVAAAALIGGGGYLYWKGKK